MTTFVPVDDVYLAARIDVARRRVVFIAPAVSMPVVDALAACFLKPGPVSITVVLDPGEESYRLGYGDPKALTKLQQLVLENRSAIRSQAGLRIGLLLIDDDVLFWSPTPRSVEEPRIDDQPNGLSITGGSGGNALASMPSLSEQLAAAVAIDDTGGPTGVAQIGGSTLTADQVAATKRALDANPPEPFDLARKTRVFSTRFQFVEHKMRGATWTRREVKISSLLLNVDFPAELQGALETRIRPFAGFADLSIPAPVLVQGELAYRQDGEPFLSPRTEAELNSEWNALLASYLYKVGRFGWLVERSRKAAFEREVTAFNEILSTWAGGFKRKVAQADDHLVDTVTEVIMSRAGRSSVPLTQGRQVVKSIVREGIERLPASKAGVKLIFKDVASEAANDEEFTDVLRDCLPPELLRGWFNTFTAARQRGA